MQEDELRSFLNRPLIAVVSTVSSRGRPHSVPVWYRYDGRRFSIWTIDSRLWVRHLKNRPDVALTIAAHEEPMPAVLVNGTARIATDEPGTDGEIRGITERYVPPNGVDAYIARWPKLRTIVWITPERVVSWSSGY